MFLINLLNTPNIFQLIHSQKKRNLRSRRQLIRPSKNSQNFCWRKITKILKCWKKRGNLQSRRPKRCRKNWIWKQDFLRASRGEWWESFAVHRCENNRCQQIGAQKVLYDQKEECDSRWQTVDHIPTAGQVQLYTVR